jgi:hypothetical protein
VRRAALLVAALVLVGAAPAAAELPVHLAGSSVGEGVPLKAYATLTPAVHLFGDTLTARLAVVADTKWVDSARLHVTASFLPYRPLRAASVVHIHSGRFEQITWTWKLRCTDSPCVPRVPRSDKYHVFHFSPAKLSYLTRSGKRQFGIDAYWPPVEVLSQVSPGTAKTLQLTKQIKWRVSLAPLGAPTYRLSPTLVLWVAVGLAAGFGALALFFLYRWFLVLRPRARLAEQAPGTPLERALAVLRYAHETGDETLQRKAFERVADELGVARADELTRIARELAWSPRTPADAEVEQFASEALGRQEDDR